MTRTINCKECNTTLGPQHDVPNPPPCPNCGCNLRMFGQSCNAQTVGSPHLAGVAFGSSGEKEFFESPRANGVSAFAKILKSFVRFGSIGRGSHGESDTLATCERLVRALNQQGGHWGAVRLGKGDVDCVAESTSKGRALQVQVVRAFSSQPFWRRLSKQLESEITPTISDAANSLFRTIELKLRIPQNQRSSLTLALDANRTPGLAFDTVIAELRRLHGAAISSFGFEAIYVVGPDDSLVKRIV